ALAAPLERAQPAHDRATVALARDRSSEGSPAPAARDERLRRLLHPLPPSAYPHDPDARQPELRRERPVRPAGAPEPSNLVVALRLDPAREPTGENRRLRDADAERLGDDAQRPSLTDHLNDLVLGRRLTPRPDRDDGCVGVDGQDRSVAQEPA